jgi:N-acetylmuramoyl-L-alanine amidase
MLAAVAAHAPVSLLVFGVLGIAAIMWVISKTQPDTEPYEPAHTAFNGFPLEPTAEGVLSGRTVVLDPGHGGHDSGAVNGQAIEKDINLSVAIKLADLLRGRGTNVVMTRTDDTFIPLDDRAGLANKLKADLFVSVHTNSNEKRTVRGVETYFFSNQSEAVAKTMLEALMAGLGEQPTWPVAYRRRQLRVLTKNERTACLCEHGYLTFPKTHDLLIQDSYQQRIAEALSQGIEKYLASVPPVKLPEVAPAPTATDVAAPPGTAAGTRPTDAAKPPVPPKADSVPAKDDRPPAST